VIPESFHFLRPAWLLALAPLALVLWAATRKGEHGSAWRRLVDQHLLRHLMLKDGERTRRWPLALGALAGLAASLAMAGPAWQQIPQPTFSSVEPTVVVLDMSPAMNGDDLSPTRLIRARHELQDILERTRGGQVGLVLYTDEPFVAAPLTDDARVIAEMLPTLESGLMPLRPARADRAIARAQALLDQAGTQGGRVVLVTAGVDADPDSRLAAAQALAASGRTLSVLGAATDAGAPLRDARGRVVSAADGTPALAALDRSGLEALASAAGGRFSELRADDGDLALVLPVRAAGAARAAQQAGSSAQFDVWRDAGVWLILIPLLLAPLAFRRGLVAAVTLTLLVATSASAETSAWSDLWSRRDQQAQAALTAGDTAGAAALFEHPEWQAAASYQNGSFAESVEAYGKLSGSENEYNLGNALARSGKLEDALARYDAALARYDAALARTPDQGDAKFNRDLVQRLLDEQRKQQEQQKQEQEQSGQGEQQDAQNQQGGAQQPQQGDGQQERQQQAGAGSEQQQEQGRGDQPADQQQAGAAEAAAQPSDDGSTGTGARPEAQDDTAAKQDRTLAQGLDQALHGEHETEPQPQTSDEDADAQPAAAGGAGQRPLTEREQAREQALRNIPDDPGGLLRAKIRRQYAEKRYSQQEVTPSW